MQEAAEDHGRPTEWLGLTLRRRADPWALGATALVAVLMDLSLHSGVLGLAGALLVILAASGLLWSGRLTNPQARALVAMAPLFGVWLFVRSSPWLIPLDVLAAGGLLLLGASLASGGSVFDLSVTSALTRGLQAVAHLGAAPAFVLRPLAEAGRRRRGDSARRARTRALLRGFALAFPVLIVLGLLLASADAVFASLFRWRTDVDPALLAGHVGALVLGAWGMAGLLRLASANRAESPAAPAWRLGAVEVTVVLASVTLLFGAFAVAQLVSLSGGGRRVIETSGLTYAEYARSGFFQLLWVAGITLCLLLALRATADLAEPPARRRFLVLSEVVVALTLVIVVVAIRRMHLYEQVFGLTMLRLYVEVFSFWIGVVFVLLGLALAGLRSTRRWLVPAAVAAGLVTLLGLNVVNPEAVVIRHNVAHAERTGRFDPAYLMELSDDAVPALVDTLPRLAPQDRSAVLSRMCPPEPLRFTGWAAYNVSLDVAYEKLVAACAVPASG